MMRFGSIGCRIVLAALLWPQLASAQVSLELSGSFAARGLLRHHARQLTTEMLRASKTRQVATLRELIQRTAPVSRGATLRYTSFPAYWSMANQTSQRTGKAFEAVLAWRANELLNNGESMSVTAAEGFHTHPSDLLRTSAKGDILQAYQAKLRLNLRNASKYLADPRYDGMRLVTTRESLARIELELEKKEVNAIRRGIALDPKWQRVKDALTEERIPRTWFGKPLPTEKGLEALVQKASREQFQSHATPLRNRWSASGLARRFGAKSVAVVGVINAGYGAYSDVTRFARGEVEGDYLAVKAPIRAAQGYVTVLLLSPEPASKGPLIVADVVLVVVDIGYELLYERVLSRRKAAAQQFLASIDRSERFHAVHDQLLAAHQSP